MKAHLWIPRVVKWMTVCLIVASAIASVGCSSSTQGAKTSEPPVVEVVQVEQKDVPIVTEWIGTTDGIVNADIKAQVPGYLLKQDYTEGSFVQKGQLLFEIDPRPFQAVVDQGEGQLAQANGQLAQAKAKIDSTLHRTGSSLQKNQDPSVKRY